MGSDRVCARVAVNAAALMTYHSLDVVPQELDEMEVTGGN